VSIFLYIVHVLFGVAVPVTLSANSFHGEPPAPLCMICRGLRNSGATPTPRRVVTVHKFMWRHQTRRLRHC